MKTVGIFSNIDKPEAMAEMAKLKAWFEGILPDYDKDKVYTSDIKKVALWYNILHKLELLVKEEAESKPSESEAAEPVKKTKAAPKKKKAAAPDSEK